MSAPLGDTNSTVTMAAWRRWAALVVLTRSPIAMTTEQIRRAIDANGWNHLLPLHGRWDAVHRALLTEEKWAKVARVGRPARWSVTDLGRGFTEDFIIGNPNIDPSKVAQP